MIILRNDLSMLCECFANALRVEQKADLNTEETIDALYDFPELDAIWERWG
jgi:hypothetical protein